MTNLAIVLLRSRCRADQESESTVIGVLGSTVQDKDHKDLTATARY